MSPCESGSSRANAIDMLDGIRALLYVVYVGDVRLYEQCVPIFPVFSNCDVLGVRFMTAFLTS
jgi:hypothetical protein